MAHQVFLSYATEDADSARLLCRVLEAEEGIRCWIAPRDVEAGTDYAAAILEAIKSAELVLLVFSSSANASPYVLREIERAIAYERPVISVRLDNTAPNASLEYYLNLWQWLEAPRGIESRRREIVASVRRQLGAARADASNRGEGETSLEPGTPAADPKIVLNPKPVAERLSDERRLVTILQVHVGGLRAIADAEDFESLSALIAPVFDRLSSCTERYGGELESIGPDSARALFGVPTAHDNDGEMAVRAAFDMRRALADFEREWTVSGLSLHAGINTGIVVVGSLGGPSATQYSVVGEAADLASFLADLSDPDDILLGPGTFQLVRTLVVAEPSGVARARGMAKEAPYYRVMGFSTQEGITSSISSVLVGREDQIVLFRQALEQLEGGLGTTIFLTGDAGVGKSRLIANVRSEASARGVRWLEGSTLSYGQNISYLPFIEILRADLGMHADDVPEEKLRTLQKRGRALFADRSAQVIPPLANLLGLSLDDSDWIPTQVDGDETGGEGLAQTLARYIRRLGTERPLILVLEDTHWLDASSLALVQDLVRLTTEAPILLCLVGRAAMGSPTLELLEATRSQPDTRRVEIQLSGLSSQQTEQLVRNLLDGGEIERKVLTTIERRSEGNPLFAEEIVRHLIDSSSLAQDARGTWRVSVRNPLIPSTLQGVIDARIDHLPKDVKEELFRASVIGRSFSHRLLLAVSPADEAELNRRLSYLRERQLVLASRRAPDLEFSFCHALVQEAVYGSILRKQRRELHRQVARAIKELSSARASDLYAVLAYHYTRAEDWEEAQDYLLKAGDWSMTMAANAEGIAYYQEALSALFAAFSESWNATDSIDQVRWLVERTEPFWSARRLGDLSDSIEAFHGKVSAACGPADPRTVATASMLAGSYFQRARYDDATAVVEQAVQALEQAGGTTDPSLVRLLMLLGYCRVAADRFSEGEEILARALVLEDANPSPNKNLLLDLHIYLGATKLSNGRYLESKLLCEEGIGRFQQNGGDRYWTLLALLSEINLVTGRWEIAADQAQRAVDHIVNPFLRAQAAARLGQIRTAQGANFEAEECLRSAVSTLEQLNHSATTAETLALLAETQLQTGKPDKAEESARKALRIWEATYSGARAEMATAWWTLAGVQLSRGILDEAELSLARCQELTQGKYPPNNPFYAELGFRRAQVRAAQGRTAEAGRDFGQAVALYRAIGGDDHPRIVQMSAQAYFLSLSCAEEYKRYISGVFTRASGLYDQVSPRFFTYLGGRLVDFAQLPPGARVLDVACGRGAVLFSAGRSVGATGEVVGVDISEGMIAEIERDITRHGPANATALRMDAECLQFSDGSFDAVLCGLALFLLPNLERALAGFYRVLKPGGWLAASTFQHYEDEPSRRWDALDGSFESRLKVAPQADTREMSSEGEIRQTLLGAGFSDIEVVADEATFYFSNEEEWWESG